MSKSNTVRLFRIENPNIPRIPDGVTSRDELKGQWFTPNLGSTMPYLRKSTQSFGKAKVVDGARLLVAEIDRSDMDKYHVSKNPLTEGMDVEGDNYLLPRDGTVVIEELALDGIVGELRGKLADPRNLLVTQARIEAVIGKSATEIHSK